MARFCPLLLVVFFSSIAMPDEPRVPVILDTDIGTDVDDAYALVLCATHKKIDLLGVVTWNAKPEVRSAIAKKLLVLAGRDDVPVASGRSKARDGHDPFWGGWEGKGLLTDGEMVEGISEKSASQLMSQLIENCDRPVTIISVGGVANVADLLDHSPQLKQKIARVVLMGGALRPIQVGKATLPPRIETNLHNDVDAAQIVLNSGLPITMTPAEVTFRTRIEPADYERLKNGSSKLAQGMLAMTDVWSPLLSGYMKMLGAELDPAVTLVMLHDPLAVLTVVEPDCVSIKPTRLRIEMEKGSIRTIEDEQGPIEVDLVTDADMPRVSRLIMDAVVSER